MLANERELREVPEVTHPTPVDRKLPNETSQPPLSHSLFNQNGKRDVPSKVLRHHILRLTRL